MKMLRLVGVLLLLLLTLSGCVPGKPSPTPVPLPPPRLLERSPAPGEEMPLDAPIRLTFDQPMDRKSVERALVISPTVPGSFAWSDERTVAFTPRESFARGARYAVRLDTGARSAQGKPLVEPVRFEFYTVGFLTVTQVQPAPGASEIAPDTAVTVVFNRPVVPLTAIENQAGLPQPLVFTPPVEGTGEWLNSSIYIFRPRDGFLPATEYTVRVPAGLTDTTGGVLSEEYRWRFRTIRPALQDYSPMPDDLYADPNGPIYLTFNQPMDHASVEANFALSCGGQPVAGRFEWEGGERPTATETASFIPAQPLPRGAECQAELKAWAQARSGPATIAVQKSWTFRVAPAPDVVETVPADGSENVYVYQSVEIRFACPMQTDVFTRYVSISPAPEPEQLEYYWQDDDTHVQISFPKEPRTRYELRLSADAPDRYGTPLGKTVRIRFTTGDLEPMAMFATEGNLGAYNAYSDTVIYVVHRNVPRLQVELYRLSVETFMQLNGFGDWDAWLKFKPDPGALVNRWTKETDAPRNQTQTTAFDLTQADGQPLPSGVYFVQLYAPGVPAGQEYWQRYMFVRSRVNLTMKQSHTEALVWATDLASGEPVPGLQVRFFTGLRAVAAEGTTDDDGLFVVRGLETGELWDAFFAVTGEPGADDFAIAYNGWEQGISPWEFGLTAEYWQTRARAYLYTDRPIYRPGQTVYFKGIVRLDDDAHYALPEGIGSVQVRITDPEGRELYHEDMALNDMGTFHGEFVLDPEAPLGSYFIEVQKTELDLYTGTSFRVAEYRKPEFQVQVTTDRDAYLAGDTIRVTAEATYYFGGAVADAPVHWSVLSRDFWFQYRCPVEGTCPWYDWTDTEWGAYGPQEYGGYGRLIAQGDTRTGPDGRITFQVPADLGAIGRSQEFIIEASVTDLSGQQVSNRTSAVVHQGEFYIGLAARGYLAQVGSSQTVDILTADWESDPVPGVALTVVFMEHRWYSVRQRDESGGFFWNWTSEDVPVFTTTVTTGPDGKAVASFTPGKAGTYRVRAVGRDSREHEVRSSTYFWVWGGEEYVPWRQESNNRIALIADKKEYRVGDVAEILVPSPYSGTVYALVTLERGHIEEARVVELKGNSEVLRIPITEAHVPNIFVSVVLVQGSARAADGTASFRMGVIQLPVSVETKRLKVALIPDRDMLKGEHYRPRETATYEVRVTDSEGKPVEAELSLRLADLAVLSLADETGPGLLDTFWSRRGLGVRTSTLLVVAARKFVREERPGAKGGGGGEGEEGLVRTRFPDTAFWDPVVRTDADGRATVQVPLPDSLTTWRMLARGVDADTRVGEASVDILSTLDLLLRPVLPRFLVVGDRAELATIVHNNTGQEQEVQVTLTVEGLALEGASSQTIRIPAGEKGKVVWPVRAEAVDQVRVRMEARAGTLYDGREDTLPVYRYSTPEVVATAGRLQGPEQRVEIVQLPKVFDPTQGELTVQIDGSLTGAMQQGLDFLEHFPYECIEQTVSRFLPNALVYQALREMGIERPELERNLSEMIRVARQRIYASQNYDGGWGWWAGEKSDPYLTAYVLQGLVEARRAHFTVDRDVLQRGREYLRSNLPSVSRLKESWEANRLAYMLYVLAESGAPSETAAAGERGVAVGLFERRHLLDRYGAAYLAVALSLYEPAERSRVDTLLSDLRGAAIVSATGAHWEEARVDYRNMNTDIRTTAIVTWALARLDPGNELLPNAVRWLMAMRKEGHWSTTQNTAWSLMGLVAYMRATRELEGDFSYTVTLNGELLGSGDVTRENIDQSRRLQVEIARLLVEEGNLLVIERLAPKAGQSGKGQLYYAAYLRYYLPADQVKAISRGITVVRQYSPVNVPAQRIDRARVGDLIRVKLTLVVPNDLYYVVVEDPLPAGCEGVDTSLKTTSVVGEPPKLRNLTAEEEERWYRDFGWGWWWFSHTEMRDEKVVLFASYLPRGTYEYTYVMRAAVPGEYLVMPSVASEMYFPEVFGRSDGARFVVEQGE